MTRRPGKLRRYIHEHMLQLDERICRFLRFPPSYDLPDNPQGRKIREFLLILASGRVQLFYENGLRVPRSLFHSRLAVMLLSDDGRTRRLVSTPYFFSSSREIVVNKHELDGPWGGFNAVSGLDGRV